MLESMGKKGLGDDDAQDTRKGDMGAGTRARKGKK